MNLKSRCVIVMSLVMAAVGPAASGAEFEEIIDRSFTLAEGGVVALENINGDVSIDVWDSAEVRMIAVKKASSQELVEGLEVRVKSDGRSVRIDTEYPSMDRQDREPDSFMRVEFTLTIPKTARLDDVDLVNGNLKVVGVEGGLSVATVNGDIEVQDCAGDAELATVNGAIEAYVNRLDHGGEVEMDSVNRRLDLYLASSIGADLQAESVNGRLANDFGIDVRKGKYVGSDFNGIIGGGGARVSLETVNGSINVHRW